MKPGQAIFAAIAAGDAQALARALPAEGPLPADVLLPGGLTPLMAATSAGEIDCLRLLLPFSDPDAVDQDRMTALGMAVFAERADLVKALLPHSNADTILTEKEPALCMAIRMGLPEMVDLLIPATNLRRLSERGHTPLMVAAFMDAPEFVRLLLPGSDPSMTSDSGDTALAHAACDGNLECLEILLPATPNPKNQDLNGFDALMWAARDGRSRVVKALIPVSDLTARSVAGQDALDMAIELSNWTAVDALACAVSLERFRALPDSLPWAAKMPAALARKEAAALQEEAFRGANPPAQPKAPRSL